jgi:hypothetical protein
LPLSSFRWTQPSYANRPVLACRDCWACRFSWVEIVSKNILVPYDAVVWFRKEEQLFLHCEQRQSFLTDVVDVDDAMSVQNNWNRNRRLFFFRSVNFNKDLTIFNRKNHLFPTQGIQEELADTLFASA